MGEISILWLGSRPTDYRTSLALKILGSYLTHSATSPLQKEFIEIPKPYATNITFYEEDRVNRNELQCFISDVPAKHLRTVGELIKQKLRLILEEEGINMERIGSVIRRDKRKLINSMETSVSSVMSDVVIAGDGIDSPQTRLT